MRLFQLEYIKDEMRKKRYKITGDTNKSDICTLLFLDTSSTNKTICRKLGIEYKKSNGYWRDARPIYLFYKKGTQLYFKSMCDLEKFLNIKINGRGFFNLLNRTFETKFGLAYFSFNSTRYNFDSLLPLQSSKFLLLMKLKTENYFFRIGVSNKEIFNFFSLHYPRKNRLRALCELFEVKHYFFSNTYIYNQKVGVGAISERGDIKSFNSITNTCNFFETDVKNIIKSMQRDIGFPYHQTLWYFTRL